MSRPGNLRITLELEVKTAVVRYGKTLIVPSASEADFAIDVTVTAFRDARGHLNDISAEYHDEPIELSADDMKRAVDKLADAEVEFTEPDFVTDGLTISGWSGRAIHR